MTTIYTVWDSDTSACVAKAIARDEAVKLLIASGLGPDTATSFVAQAGPPGSLALERYGFTILVEELECLDGPEGCEGEVELRLLPDNIVKAWPRCTAHFERRLDQAERNLELMSPTPPAWFDPADAGEVWGEDDY